MTRGRPKAEAPEGYYTVSQAAKALGITDAAIRRRQERGTLPREEHVVQTSTGKDEVLILIPEQAVRGAVAERSLPPTRRDTQEVELQLDENTAIVRGDFAAGFELLRQGQREMKAAIERQEQHILEELKRQGEDRHQQFEYIIELLRRTEEASERDREHQRKAAQVEKEYQADMARKVERFLELQEKHVAKWSGKPWWRRIFGG